MLKNRLAYIVLLLGAYWLAVMYESYYMAVVFRALIILPLIFFTLNYACAAMLSVKRLKDETEANVGDYVYIGVFIKNRMPVPIQKLAIYYTITDNFGNKNKQAAFTNMKMLEGTDVYIQFRTSGARGGIVSINKIYVYDFLGMFRSRRRFRKFDVRYYVYPESHESNLIVEREVPDMDNAVEAYSAVKPGNDRNELFDIREYREGDNIRNIHWKLSAKKDDVLVKEFSLPLRQDIYVIFDPYISREARHAKNMDYTYRLMNRYFELVHSISAALVNQFCSHLVCAGNGEFLTVSDEGEADAMEKSALSVREEAGGFGKRIDIDGVRGSLIYVAIYPDRHFLDMMAVTGKIKNMIVIAIGNDTEKHIKEARVFAEEILSRNCGVKFIISDISESIEEMQAFRI